MMTLPRVKSQSRACFGIIEFVLEVSIACRAVPSISCIFAQHLADRDATLFFTCNNFVKMNM